MNQVKVRQGQLVTINFEGREFEAIVIDPNGLGKNQPSVGFGFGMMDRHGGLPQSTSSQWVESHPNTGNGWLKLPSGNTYRVILILGEDENEYLVVEVSDWVAIAVDVLKKPGKVRKSTQGKLLDFLGWFAVKGFYADSYAALKGAYTAKDSRALSEWMQVRISGKHKRNAYTDFLQSQGCEGREYAFWTDYVYTALFKKQAWQMRRDWDVVEGAKAIARNHIAESRALEMVAYCESMVENLHVDSVRQAHDDAISYTIRKFKVV